MAEVLRRAYDWRKWERETSGDGAKMVNQQVWRINKKKVWSAMTRMRNGKAVGPDGIPEKVRRWERAVDLLTSLFNAILQNKMMENRESDYY